MGNYSDIIRMTQDLCSQVLKDSGGEDSKKCFAERMSTVHRLKVLVNSFRRLVLKLQDFVAYQDVLAPYISGLIQVRIPVKCPVSIYGHSGYVRTTP